MEVHRAGGGILFTVRKTREATLQRLEDLLVERLERMLKAGMTRCWKYPDTILQRVLLYIRFCGCRRWREQKPITKDLLFLKREF